MKHLNKYLSLALALVLCLSLAACGESNEDYGDDGSDYNLYGVPDSFEGLVKDSKQMSNLYLYGGAWKGEDGGTLISDTNDDGDEVRFALYDAGEELTASGFIQFVPDYDYDYFYNEHDGVAYRSWFDEVGALHVAELGTFTQMTGDAPGENTGDIDFEMMAGTWYLDAEADAPSILVFDENGGWELLERPGGDGDPTTLTVAMECAYAPYNWTQSDDSNGAVEIRGSSDYAYGYDVMMAKKIGEALGQKVQIVKLDWDSLIPAVMSGDVDCVIAGQSITAERAAQVDFSDPYYYASIITLTKKDSAYANAASVADLAGATATSQLGTIWYDTCLPQIENANILPAQETAPAMLVALNSGACDIVVTDRPTGQAALVAYPDFTLLDFGGGDGDFQVSDEDINIGISMKKGNTALKDAINEVLATMTTDDYNALMDEAISVQPLSDN